MSMKTWEEEFYPTDAYLMETDAEAVAHSLQKWKGLREEALKKHELRKKASWIVLGDMNDVFFIDSSTCALCIKHDENCETCPITTIAPKCDMAASAYRHWCKLSDPEPMIELLTELAAEEITNAAK